MYYVVVLKRLSRNIYFVVFLLVIYVVVLMTLSRRVERTPIPGGSSRWCGVERPHAPLIGDYIHEHPPINNTHLRLEELDLYDYIIVVQVRHSLHELQRLIYGLQGTQGIGRSLLVFSLYCDNVGIMELVNGVNFTQVLAVFYPFSERVCPTSYPGPSPVYCTISGCFDYLAGSRNVELSQSKLFWWWTVNFVYEVLNLGNNYSNNVILLEDDDVITPDFILMGDLLEEQSHVVGVNHSVYSFNCLGVTAEVRGEDVVIGPFLSIDFSTGLMFNMKTYAAIRSSSHDICHYDEHDWANSLRMALSNFTVIAVAKSRVAKLEDFIRFWSVNYKDMFPVELKVQRFEEEWPPSRGGYWGDRRDVNLCLLMGNVTSLHRMFETLAPASDVTADPSYSLKSQL